MSKVFARIGSFDLTTHRTPLYASIDLHTCGEPLRVIVSGIPKLTGNSVLAKRNELSLNFDFVRRLLMYEPRGHRDMYGCVLVEPDSSDADIGVIFMHNEGYSTMCGHGIIAITKLVKELGWKRPVDNRLILNIDAPCGLIISEIDLSSDDEFSIKFEGVPSFVLLEEQSINLPGFGPIIYDIAYGGAFYAYVDADSIGLTLNPENIAKIVHLGRQLKKAIIATSGTYINHPKQEDLSFLYGVIFRSRSMAVESGYLNVCVFADGEVDRSPTGSGVCGTLALLKHKKLIGFQEDIVIESIIGTRFKGSIKSAVRYEGFDAVVPMVAGNAYITGHHNFYLDSSDPIREGFILG